MSTWSKMSMMNGNSPLMEKMIILHDYMMMFILLITTAILTMLMMTIKKTTHFVNFKESQNMEILWTLSPAIILIMIAMPSMKTLYSLEESNPMMTVKATGHQWYWSYTYPEMNNMEFDSYMKPSTMKNMRLLQVDNTLKIPYMMNTRFLISSEDVIHAWTIPSLAVKTDAIPGRINQLNMWIKRPGTYFGQCSEICGANHSFMPIMMEVMNIKNVNL